MKISYNKLWKLLIDRNITKKELAEGSGISQTSINKLKNGLNVNTDILVKICTYLNCDFDDILELLND
jgi:DNA-binding Xre family transcriptional regulator